MIETGNLYKYANNTIKSFYNNGLDKQIKELSIKINSSNKMHEKKELLNKKTQLEKEKIQI